MNEAEEAKKSGNNKAKVQKHWERPETPDDQGAKLAKSEREKEKNRETLVKRGAGANEEQVKLINHKAGTKKRTKAGGEVAEKS